jgi:putative ATP-dependent endonuclease of the OLD family
MYVCHLSISGFRGIRSAEIVFGPHSVLLGANNVGKSAIVDALGLVLGRDKLVRTLGDYDFFGGLPTPTSRIRIVATVTGFVPDDPDKQFEWFNAKDGAVALWWDGTKVHHVPDRPKDTQVCAQIAFVARFDEEELEVETIRYFLDGDGDPFEQDVTTVKQNHLKAAGFFLLPSHRTWDRVVSFGSELFRRVVKFQDAIPAKAVTDLRASLRDPTVKLEEDEHIKDLVERLDSEIDGFIGSDSSGLRFRPTSGDIEGVLQALTPHLPGKAKTMLPVSKHGSGVISLQTLLLLFEFGRSRHGKGENFILAAEEPELHLHPGHHSRLVARIRGTSDQSITTTHSPEIAAYYSPHEVLILRNDNGTMNAIPLIPSGEEVPDRNALMQLYTVHRAAICEALMHHTVIIPEGKTEFQWFRSLLRLRVAVEGWENTCEGDEAVGILPTTDAQVVMIYERFQPLVPRAVPLVDGDGAGDEYVKKLRKVTPAPGLILQLSSGNTLENVIAWLLSPNEPSDWTAIAAILTNLVSHTQAALIAELTTNKVNWRLHEDLLGYIGTHGAAKRRLADFCDGLCELAVTGTTTKDCWSHDSTRNKGSALWRWVST